MNNHLNLTWHKYKISKQDRQRQNKHKSCVIWFTGLSGSGKSTLANSLDQRLYELGKRSYVLDGDNIRHGLNRDLGFSKEDRRENIRRIGEISKLFVDSGTIVLTAFISPFRNDRRMVKRLFQDDEFIEIYVKCPLSICEKRDPKGLYKKARDGEIPEFTGITSPYEPPINPALTIESNQLSIQQSIDNIIQLLENKGILTS